MSFHKELETTVRLLTASGKGILAADESTGTIAKRFSSNGIENLEENRRSYRELLFTTPGMENAISGVIFFEETLGQKAKDGTSFPALLAKKGVVPGIKVDKGTVALPGRPGELVTQGLDGLGEALKQHKAMGARFAKWRAVITIGEGIPSSTCIAVNAHALARYAALCTEAGIVPIVEPEVLMDADNSIERCFEVTSDTLHAVFDELHRQRVVLEHILLKPNMVISGKKCAVQAGVTQVAEQTLRCFCAHVPAAVPGIVFLSGGQSDEDATAHLDAIARLGPHPWSVSFSYGRALQAPAIKAWGGKAANWKAGQAAFAHRARMNAAAQQGKYSASMEREAAKV
ncbi:MAG TPA: class I fructose-bisphosphate aldolase [Planctomycetota bacterium]|nr:class I fructose-bisphosphate aldolase [Planctomycetota bacterium]